MARSKCPKCENSSFEVSQNVPSKSNFEIMLVQCSKCGTVLGAMDFWNIGTLLKDLEKKVDSGKSISSLTSHLEIINSNIAKLFQLMQNTNAKLEIIASKVGKK